MPDTAWKDGTVDLEALKGEWDARGKPADLPDSPQAYELPTVEGIEAKDLAESPFIQTMMKVAHANGVGNAAFQQMVGEYYAGESDRVNTAYTEEMKKVGANAETRLKSIETWLGGSLPADQAKAVMETATTADAIKGLEALMNARVSTAPREPSPPPPARATKAEIDALMASDAYRGDQQGKRDLAVVKKVDDWFQAEYAAKP